MASTEPRGRTRRPRGLVRDHDTAVPPMTTLAEQYINESAMEGEEEEMEVEVE